MLPVGEQQAMDSTEIPPKAKEISHWSGAAREQAVQRMFTAIARFYDLNNSILSFGLHHAWKRRAARNIPISVGGRALDIGAGTADLALLIEHKMGQGGRVLATDLNEAMKVAAGLPRKSYRRQATTFPTHSGR